MKLNDIFTNCVHSLTDPRKAAKQVMKGDITDGVIAVVIGSLLPAIIAVIVIIIATSAITNFGQFMPGMNEQVLAQMTGFMTTAGVAIGISMLIVIPILAIIGWLINSLIIWVVARLMGGKGGYLDFAKAWAFPTAAVFALVWIPIVSILLGIYLLYVLYVFLQPVMKMKPDKAMLTVVAVIIIGIVLWLLSALAGTLTGAGTCPMCGTGG